MLVFFMLIIKIRVLGAAFDEDIDLLMPGQKLYSSPDDIPNDKYLGMFNNCTCHESPKMLVVCSGENCRDFPVLSINTPLFKLKLSSVEIIRKNDFIMFDDLEALELEANNMLKRIEPGCFRRMNKLRNLTIINSFNLINVEESTFEGLLNLRILNMGKNGFRRVVDATRGLETKYVPELQLLDLSQNIFHTIEEHEFYFMNNTGLQQLSLSLCGLVYIHPNCLRPFSNLTVLRLGQNLCNKTTLTDLIIKTVEFGIPLDLLNLIDSGFRKYLPFELLKAVGRSNITDLVLGRNHFDEIEDDSFPEMNQLLVMDLRECNIRSISNNAFEKLISLETSLLNRNRLGFVPLGVILPNLLLLDLSSNSDEDNYFGIPDRIFQNLSNLYDLHLSYNNIVYITKETFYGLSNLTRLNLKSCQLTSIEEGAFIHLPKLLLLNLNNNPLLILSAETFRGLHAVNITLLAHCGIKNLTTYPGLLYHLRNITYLGLENNEIQMINPDQLTHLNQLKMLRLENNKLTAWFKPILPKNDYKEIYVSKNKLMFLTSAMLEDFKSTDVLFLDGNPFRCDCSLYPMVQWLRHNRLKLNYSEKNFIAKCDSPEKWMQISFLEYIKYLNNNSNICEITPTYLTLITSIICITLLIIIIIFIHVFKWYIRYWIFLIRINLMKHSLWITKKPEEEICYQYDAFVSYSVEDKPWVVQLCEKLEPDVKLCIFERDFPPGSTISHAILTAVANSKRTILVVSEAFARSNWCRWETQIAQYHQIFFRKESINGPDDTLLLVRLEPVKKYASPILKYLMKTRIYLDWPQETENQSIFWNRLKISLSYPKGNNKKISNYV